MGAAVGVEIFLSRLLAAAEASSAVGDVGRARVRVWRENGGASTNGTFSKTPKSNPKP